MPKRVDKADAAKLFRQLRIKRRIPFATLLDAMARYGRQFTPLGAEDPKFAVGPARWLRGEKWSDEPPASDQPLSHPSHITPSNPTGRVISRLTGGLD
ncbi:hypothetical protein [Acidisphaera sp. S103]|uniref:hypothetical protein n=1 Tax=Acidisphaera sp. S103 TaxID=1747223 RepID=UPI0020B11358|nr:hypothetical protein [Acidisphaera sp. S103]